MGRYIVKLTDPTDNQAYYLEWSTVVDAPVTYGLSLAEFRDHYRDEYGREGMRSLDRRLDRVEQTGTSSLGFDLEDVISDNRAGPDETELDVEGILERYCRTREG